jgi:hypothetical protein
VIRGLSNVGQYGQAKQCVINAFDTDFIMSAVRVMGSIFHQAQNLDAEDTFTSDIAASEHPVNAFLAHRSPHVVAVLEVGLLINVQRDPSFP